MKLINKSHGQKGATNMMYIVITILIAIVAFYAIRHYQDRDRDIVIHVPHVEVH